MPLAKSADTVQTTQPTQQQNPSGAVSPMTWEGVPIDIFRNFSMDLGTTPTKEIEKVREIYEWAKGKCDEPTLGNIMQKITSIINQLGSPALDEKRWDKAWRWIKMTKQIEDLEKRRESMRSRWSF